MRHIQIEFRHESGVPDVSLIVARQTDNAGLNTAIGKRPFKRQWQMQPLEVAFGADDPGVIGFRKQPDAL